MQSLFELGSSDVGKSSWPWVLDQKDIVIYEASVTWPKISIVTPSFNQGRYIEQTIRSVLLQNYPNLEYIIIDGGSTDETIEIIKKYEEFITYWSSDKDSGQSEAINKGLQKCTGQIFNWLNSDDWYEPGALLAVARAFTKNPGIVSVSGMENHVTPDKVVSVHTGSFLAKTIEETIEFCEVAQPSTFFKLDAVKKAGGVSPDLHYIMDGELWVKILLQYGMDSFYKLEKILVNFRLHPQSKTGSAFAGRHYLQERYSIVTDLQRATDVPGNIIAYYKEKIYNSPESCFLFRNWQFNDLIISSRRLQLYFVRKYIIKSFRRKNKRQAFLGLKYLVANRSIDAFFLRNAIKLLMPWK